MPKPYLTITIHRPGGEWVWLVNEIIKAVPTAQPGRDTVGQMDEAGNYVFYLSRETFSADLVGSKLGFAPTDIAHEDVIDLWPMYDPKKFPKPTVDYWGHG